MPSTNRRPHTREQRELYTRVLLRDGYRCQIQYPGEWTVVRGGGTRHCMGTADCVHHTRGPEVESMEYLVAACTPCNLKVGKPSSTTDPPHRPMTRW